MFGEIPAYGFLIRHVRGLEMNGVSVSFLKDDIRAPFIISDATSVEFRNLKAQRIPGVPAFILKDVNDFAIRDSYPLADVRLPSVKQQTVN